MTTAAPAAPAAAPAAPSSTATPAAGGQPSDKPAGAAPAPDAKPGDGAAPKPPEGPKKRKVVVDGQTHEIDEDKLDSYIQKGIGSEKRFAEAAKLRQDLEAVFGAMEKNPMAVLERYAKLTGQDPRKVVEDWLWENHVKLEQMTPEQKEAEQNRRKLQELENEKKAAATKAEQEKAQKLREHYHAEYQKDIMGALDKGGIPKTPGTVRRMAHYMAQGLSIGVKLTAADVLPLVEADYRAEFQEMFGKSSAEMLAKFLGDDSLKKLREFELARLKMQGANGAPDNPPPAPPAGGAPAGEKKGLTKEEWRAELDRRAPLK